MEFSNVCYLNNFIYLFYSILWLFILTKQFWAVNKVSGFKNSTVNHFRKHRKNITKTSKQKKQWRVKATTTPLNFIYFLTLFAWANSQILKTFWKANRVRAILNLHGEFAWQKRHPSWIPKKVVFFNQNPLPPSTHPPHSPRVILKGWIDSIGEKFQGF